MSLAHIANPPQHLRDLHAHYCARSGFDIAYNMMRENTWKEWLQFCSWSWGKEELSRVIYYLRSEIKRQKRNEGALRFSNLIGDPARFEEDLGFARKDAETCAAFRKPAAKPPPPPPPPDPQDEPIAGASFFMSQLKKQA